MEREGNGKGEGRKERLPLLPFRRKPESHSRDSENFPRSGTLQWSPVGECGFAAEIPAYAGMEGEAELEGEAEMERETGMGGKRKMKRERIRPRFHGKHRPKKNIFPFGFVGDWPCYTFVKGEKNTNDFRFIRRRYQRI